MALSAATVWEVRTTGSDSNGGGFVTGATGSDYSQQDSAQYSGTNLVIDATTNTKVTSATHNFVAADVGNLLQITAGTGFSTGFYQIVSVASNAATLDRSAGTLGSTGGTFAVGGALASPGKAAGAVVAGNDVWMRSGTYSITTSTANVSGGPVNLTVGGVDDTNQLRWIGYGTVRGDGGGPPVLQVAATGVTSITIFTAGGQRTQVENLAFDGQSKSAIRGYSSAGTARTIRCLARNCTNAGFSIAGYGIWFCRATGCSSVRAFDLFGAAHAVGCVADANTTYGFVGSTGTRCIACLSVQNSGSGTDGFYATGDGVVFLGCTAAGNGQHGFNLDGAALFNPTLLDCVSYGNGGYGYTAAGVRDVAGLLNCAGGANTSGNVNSTNLPRLESFVTLTVDPFTNSAGGDYSLNTAAGGGALLRGTGLPGAFPGGTTIGYPDIGAAQHADSGGGGTPRRVWG